MPQYKRTFFKGVFFSYFYIFIYFLTGILTTPLLLNHFNPDYFALLMLVYAIITYLNNIRFGLPESLAALLAKSKDTFLNKNMVKRSFYLLTCGIILTFIIMSGIEFIINDWRIVLGDVYSLNKETVLSVFYILVIFALLKIPLDLSLSVFIGYHEVYLEKIYKTVTLVVNFILILFVVYNNIDIITFTLWAGLFDLIHIILKYKVFKESDSLNPIPYTTLFKSGALFFQLSMTQAIIWSTGVFLVSHLLSLSEVTTYSLTMKIYVYLFYGFVIINTVVAPLYGKHYSNNDWSSIQKVFNLVILFLPFLGGVIWIGTLFFMSDVMRLWTGSSEFDIGLGFVGLMGAFFYFTGYVNSYITFLYSITEVRSILYIRWKEVTANVIISFIATYFFGIIGIAIGITFAIFLISIQEFPKKIELKTNNQIVVNLDIHKKHFFFVLVPSIIMSFFSAIYIESLGIKIGVFLFVCIYYFTFSWKILLRDTKILILTSLGLIKEKLEK